MSNLRAQNPSKIMPQSKSRNSKSNVNLVTALTSSSNCDLNSTGPNLCIRDKDAQPQGSSHHSKGAGHGVPAWSLIPAAQRQNQPPGQVRQAQHTASAEKARSHKCMSSIGIPSDSFPIHPGDVIPLAHYGYDIRVSEIAARLGFHQNITQEVYEHVSNLRQMEEVLCAMQEAAKQCGEARIRELVAGDDLDTDSEA
ncbi:hypothetical protein L210DRAFT_989726 [Boletus edulis BED1]|uniref:Uncharacterized protein n=1 Tax=Boletus edulis BED1 TaxID=1328754 RepID=A0AAD4GJ92_BOLED|nr:hypothetical protein L210DRAFT_989726 [Boletus edulis BED1]